MKNYLINKSIAAERLSVEGLGSNKPVADNATADGRKKNRRIEFILRIMYIMLNSISKTVAYATSVGATARHCESQ